MPYAQIVCPKLELADKPGEAALTTVTNTGSVFAAMMHFGIGYPFDLNDANLATTLTREVPKVKCKLLKGCSIEFDSVRDASVYDATEAGSAKATVSSDGIISTEFTGDGVHFYSAGGTRHTGQNIRARIDAVLAAAKAKYETRYSENDTLYAVRIDATNAASKDTMFFLDQKNISIPVLEYEGKICIDFRPNQAILGIKKTVRNSDDLVDVTTRDLFFADELSRTAALATPTGTGRQAMYYRPIDNKERKTGQSPAWYDTFNRNIMLTLEMFDVSMNANLALRTQSILGSCVPLKILNEDEDGENTQGCCIIAPLNIHVGTDHTATVTHSTGLDADLLADRMSRTGSRNIIGVAMQKIAPNTQGDLMLHDGV